MYLSFDIGGTFIKYAWMNRDGEIKKEGKFNTPYRSPDYLVSRMVDIFKTSPFKVKGIAISCPGTIDVETGMIKYGGALTYLHEKNLPKMLSEQCLVPVSIENDGKCVALAEIWKGSVKDYPNSVVLAFGTGVGGGIIINGKLHRGANLEAGEQSYVMEGINHDTKEAYFVAESCSASKMVNRVARLKGLPNNDGIGVFKYIEAEDPETLAIFYPFCLNIAVQILNLQYIIDPDVFAVGGGISVQPAFIEGINSAIALIKEVNPHHIASPKIIPCHFSSAANLYGALYHHLLQFETTTA